MKAFRGLIESDSVDFEGGGRRIRFSRPDLSAIDAELLSRDATIDVATWSLAADADPWPLCFRLPEASTDPPTTPGPWGRVLSCAAQGPPEGGIIRLYDVIPTPATRSLIGHVHYGFDYADFSPQGGYVEFCKRGDHRSTVRIRARVRAAVDWGRARGGRPASDADSPSRGRSLLGPGFFHDAGPALDESGITFRNVRLLAPMGPWRKDQYFPGAYLGFEGGFLAFGDPDRIRISPAYIPLGRAEGDAPTYTKDWACACPALVVDAGTRVHAEVETWKGPMRLPMDRGAAGVDAVPGTEIRVLVQVDRGRILGVISPHAVSI